MAYADDIRRLEAELAKAGDENEALERYAREIKPLTRDAIDRMTLAEFRRHERCIMNAARHVDEPQPARLFTQQEVNRLIERRLARFAAKTPVQGRVDLLKPSAMCVCGHNWKDHDPGTTDCLYVFDDRHGRECGCEEFQLVAAPARHVEDTKDE